MKTKNPIMLPGAPLFLWALVLIHPARAAFVHPGCLHDQNDINRMQTQVAANAQPWLGGWNNLTASTFAQNTRVANPVQVVTRGCADSCSENYTSCMQDAAAAYQNALRYVISGDTSYANCAVNILNAWASTLTQIDPCCSDHALLAGIQGYQFAGAAELLRNYSGWSATSFNAFKQWMLNVWYPNNHDFLTTHFNTCISHYWCNWDACNLASMISIGVLCDNQAVFDEAVNYFKTGAGNGALAQAVFYTHGPGLGQWQESGRDQGHTQLGVGLESYVCEVAWKQGVDLYGYVSSGKTLIDGSEYVASYNLGNTVPYTTYNNCDNVNQTSIYSLDRGVNTNRTFWDMTYNAWVRKGLTATYTSQMATALRPDHGGGYGSTSASWAFDHIGFSTLTHYLGSTPPPSPPPVPTGLTATPGNAQVSLSWSASSGATSYNVKRATVSGGPYTTLASDVTSTSYTDPGPTNGTTYYYVVSAVNSVGESANSAQVSATPSAGSVWTDVDIGAVGTAGSGTLNGSVYTVKGAGSDIGGTADSLNFMYKSMTGDGTIIARLATETIGGAVNDKVGLTMRETTSSGSKHVAVLLDSGLGSSRLVSRSSSGGGSTWVNGPSGTTLPRWYKLVRAGNTFTGYVSTDGSTWSTVGSATVTMTSTLQVGFCVCSRDTGALNTSTFDNVTAP